MKRYSIDSTPDATEDPEGEWVKWEDARLNDMENTNTWRSHSQMSAELIDAQSLLRRRNSWNRNIRDGVDKLLAEAGYLPDSSARHQLASMNFDDQP